MSRGMTEEESTSSGSLVKAMSTAYEIFDRGSQVLVVRLF